MEKEALGTWEIHCGLGVNPSMLTERTIHRKAEAAMEVGPTDSTLSMGKPCTRGSGWAKLGLR